MSELVVWLALAVVIASSVLLAVGLRELRAAAATIEHKGPPALGYVRLGQYEFVVQRVHMNGGGFSVTYTIPSSVEIDMRGELPFDIIDSYGQLVVSGMTYPQGMKTTGSVWEYEQSCWFDNDDKKTDRRRAFDRRATPIAHEH